MMLRPQCSEMMTNLKPLPSHKHHTDTKPATVVSACSLNPILHPVSPRHYSLLFNSNLTKSHLTASVGFLLSMFMLWFVHGLADSMQILLLLYALKKLRFLCY